VAIRGADAREAGATGMNRLFDKATRDRRVLRWLGTRPVDDVRAAERRARVTTGLRPRRVDPLPARPPR